MDVKRELIRLRQFLEGTPAALPAAPQPGRRTVLAGGIAMAAAGDGLVRPLNAPPAQHVQPGVQPGVSPGTFIGRLVLVFGPTGAISGIFVYGVGTTPGPGNIPIFWITQIGVTTDPFGNTLPRSGMGGRSSTGFTVINNGQLAFGVNTAGSFDGTVFESQAGKLVITSGKLASGGQVAGISVESSDTVGGSGFAAARLDVFTGLIAGKRVILQPSGDTTGATDATVVNAALAAFNEVILTGGLWYINAPLAIPSGTLLQGPIEVTLTNGAPVSRIIGVAGFAGAGMVTFTNSVDAQLKNVYLDGSAIPGSTVNGVNMSGTCYDVNLEEVLVYKAPHNGVVSSNFHHRMRRVTADHCGNFGFRLVSCTDSTFADCLAFQNTQANWSIADASNSVFTACRAEWSGSDGWSLDNSANWSGTAVFNGCTTDQNSGNGWHISGITLPAQQGAGIVISGGKCHADRGTDAMRVVSCNIPVLITGVNIDVGQDPNVPANYWPLNGMFFQNNKVVNVTGCVIQSVNAAATGPWSWDNLGVMCRAGVIQGTGLPGAQTYTRLADI